MTNKISNLVKNLVTLISTVWSVWAHYIQEIAYPKASNSIHGYYDFFRFFSADIIIQSADVIRGQPADNLIYLYNS